MESTERRFTLVVNPAAGNGRASAAADRLGHALSGPDERCVTVRTAHIAEAEQVAREAAAAGRVAVAVGGDGIVGRVAGALAFTGGTMGILPCGRGNDIARYLGIPAALPRACEVLLGGSVRTIDLAEVNGQRYVSIASGGIDSEVNAIASRTHLLHGRAVYTYGALRALAVWRPASFQLEVDGESVAYTGFSFGVANSTSYGGGIHLAPHASVDDGLLDVVTISHMSKPHALRAFPRMYSGTHLREAAVTVHRASRVIVKADRDFLVYADGEPVAPLPATFSALPQALRILTPGSPETR